MTLDTIIKSKAYRKSPPFILTAKSTHIADLLSSDLFCDLCIVKTDIVSSDLINVENEYSIIFLA